MVCCYVLIAWILTYTASSATEILISESFHGLGVSSLLPISFLGMSEMLAPKYRFISMQAFGIAQGIGMSTTGILGRFIHFKTISIIMSVPIAIAVTIAVMWPESPSWLACKGEFAKCERAFIQLRGSGQISAKELSDLITAQKEILSREPSKTTLNGLWRQITSRDFYTPAFHIFILMNMMYWSGCDVVIIYFLDMASKSTSNENATFYAVIVMYVLIVAGLALTYLLIIRFENKKVLLTSTFFVAVFLSCACVITGLQTLGIVSKDSLLCVICLLLCISSACLGLDSIIFIISAELMPVKHRSFGGALYIIFNCILYASSQKLSPYLFMYIDLWGTFLLYAVNASLCALFVWKYVPETKRKSLQEIEDYYIYGSFVDRDTGENVSLVDKNLRANGEELKNIINMPNDRGL